MPTATTIPTTTCGQCRRPTEADQLQLAALKLLCPGCVAAFSRRWHGNALPGQSAVAMTGLWKEVAA